MEVLSMRTVRSNREHSLSVGAQHEIINSQSQIFLIFVANGAIHTASVIAMVRETRSVIRNARRSLTTWNSSFTYLFIQNNLYQLGTVC